MAELFVLVEVLQLVQVSELAVVCILVELCQEAVWWHRLNCGIYQYSSKKSLGQVGKSR